MASLQHNTFSLNLYYNASWTGHLSVLASFTHQYWHRSNTIDCTTTQHLCITMQVERDICIGPPAAWGSTRRQNVPFSSTKHFTIIFLFLVLACVSVFVDHWCAFGGTCRPILGWLPPHCCRCAPDFCGRTSTNSAICAIYTNCGKVHSLFAQFVLIVAYCLCDLCDLRR